MTWRVCQIGGREHYAVARALSSVGGLKRLYSDFWVPPESGFSSLPGGRRLRDRFHEDLAEAEVWAANGRFFLGEISDRIAKRDPWASNLRRNQSFQSAVLKQWQAERGESAKSSVVFSYSYAARDLFRYAKAQGWKTVLGQIDPGPEEERIVEAELKQFPEMGSLWSKTPAGYWDSWREEVELADHIVVNSEWSKSCLLKEGADPEKIVVLPLVYQSSVQEDSNRNKGSEQSQKTKRLLFLGQINLRKGVARLLKAMELLKDEDVELILVGPSEIPESAWSHLTNVSWRGPLPRSEVGSAYQQADLFILPTLSDGFALTQLEAMAHGLPVIASQHCGEVVREGENGWLLPDLEPETIAATIRKALIGLPLEVEAPSFGLEDMGVALEQLVADR